MFCAGAALPPKGAGEQAAGGEHTNPARAHGPNYPRQVASNSGSAGLWVTCFSLLFME